MNFQVFIFLIKQNMFHFCRFLHLCIPLCGKGKCEEAVEDLPVLWQDETSREFRLEINTGHRAHSCSCLVLETCEWLQQIHFWFIWMFSFKVNDFCLCNTWWFILLHIIGHICLLLFHRMESHCNSEDCEEGFPYQTHISSFLKILQWQQLNQLVFIPCQWLFKSNEWHW